MIQLTNQQHTSASSGHPESKEASGPIDIERLLRFAMASARLLAEDSEKRIQWMNSHA